MSYPLRYTACMNMETVQVQLCEFLVATFGRARLVRTTAGRYELRGGSVREYQEALEWCSLFLPEAVIWAN